MKYIIHLEQYEFIIKNDSYYEYINLINVALSDKTRNKNISYYEIHHILPKSTFKNFHKEKWNLVLLTAIEHVEAHILLSEFATNKFKISMQYALNFMSISSQNQIRQMTLEQCDIYNKNKKEISELRRKLWKENNPNNWHDRSGKNNGMYGSNRIGDLNPFYNKKHTTETINHLKHVAKNRNYNGNKNPNAKRIKFIDPLNNEYIVVGGFKNFCIEFDIPYNTMLKSLHIQQHPLSGKAAGWKAQIID